MLIITTKDIESACGTISPSRDEVRQYLHQLRDEDDYLVLHLPEDYKIKSYIHEVMCQCMEVWIIRQIGPAKCIKHRYRPTPFECLF